MWDKTIDLKTVVRTMVSSTIVASYEEPAFVKQLKVNVELDEQAQPMVKFVVVTKVYGDASRSTWSIHEYPTKNAKLAVELYNQAHDVERQPVPRRAHDVDLPF